MSFDKQSGGLEANSHVAAVLGFTQLPSNKALQTDKDNLSCLLHSQKSRQLDFAAELGRYAS